MVCVMHQTDLVCLLFFGAKEDDTFEKKNKDTNSKYSPMDKEKERAK